MTIIATLAEGDVLFVNLNNVVEWIDDKKKVVALLEVYESPEGGLSELFGDNREYRHTEVPIRCEACGRRFT